MDNRIMLGIAFMGVILIAGCVNGLSSLPDANGDEEEEVVVEGGVSVTGPDCTVDGLDCGTAQITRFSVPELSVTVRNEGLTPADIDIGEPGTGDELLVSMCDEYHVREFDAEITGRAGGDVTGQDSATLEPGEQLEFTWYVEPAPGADTDELLSCVIRFNLVLEQDLQTIQQVQVREDRTVTRLTGLSYDTASDMPVELIIDADDSIVEDVVGGERIPVQATAYVRNRGHGTVTDVSHPTMPTHIHVYLPGAMRSDCSNQDIVGGVDDGTGQNQARICSFQVPSVSHSQVVDLIAETRYAYEMELDPVEIRLGGLEVDG